MASNISSPAGKSHRWARVFAGFVAAGSLGMGLGLFSAPIAGADTPAPVPALPGGPAAGNQMGNAFLHVLGSMLGKVVPGAEQMIPANLPEPGAPGLTGGPGAPAPAPAAHVGQTIA